MTTPVLEYQEPLEQPTSSVGVRLSIMMFLQYAVWGVWLPYLASYLQTPVAGGGLGFTSGQVGWVLGLAASIGAVTAPFLSGQIADRYVNAERALAGLLLVGGVLNFALARTHHFLLFLVVSVVYSVAFMPTLSLSNSIAFQNLADPERGFPPVRLWGTVGWAIASTLFTLVWLNTADPVANTRRIADALTVSGVLSVGYAAYALLALPRTPPKRNVESPLAFAKAFGLLRDPLFLLVTLVALPIAMIHQIYFIRGAPFFEAVVGVTKAHLGPVLAIGQVSEIVFLLLLGTFLKRLGYKAVLILGCLGYAARFGIFAVGQPWWFVIACQALHGLCYGCFFAGSFLLVERIAGADIRHSAQAVFGIIILGVGPIMALVYNAYGLKYFQTPSGINYAGIWWTESAIALACGLVLLLLFRERPFVNGHTPQAATHHEGHLA